MKDAALFLIFNSATIICSAGAVWMAMEGADGWGWFLIAAVLSQATKTP